MDKTIKIEYKVPSGQRPTWLLSFIGIELAYFDHIDESDIPATLHKISNKLDEQFFYQRKLKRSCIHIRREVVGNRLDIYSSTGKRVLATIEFI